MEQLADVLAGSLGDAVYIPRNGGDILGHPGGRCARRRRQGTPESACRAGEDKRPHTGRGGRLQQVERTSYVGVDECLPAMRDDVRLMQGRGMHYGAYAVHGSLYQSAIGD